MARDLFHDAVRNALEKNGCISRTTLISCRYGSSDDQVDLGAEGLVGAEREGQRIAIEIKSFLGRSPQHQLHEAIGQFVNYRILLETVEPERELYLAVTDVVFNDLFLLPFVQLNFATGFD
ncbi:MAG: fatty-acid oxidation protein subunit alpha [Pleurocapsa sp. SU_196_0]|nr:fatty-acid oxidation protein subunit alpha [Pleurocapsa sp. SU_196_0]